MTRKTQPDLDFPPPDEEGRPFAHFPRLMGRTTQFVLDLGVLAGAFVAGYLLRFEFVLDAERARAR